MNNAHFTRIIKTGNSLSIVIPVNVLRALKIERGDQMVFSIADNDVICLRKITDAEKFNLQPRDVNI